MNEQVLKLFRQIVTTTNLWQTPKISNFQVTSFFKPKISARKCSCGEAFAFKVGEMLQFINRGGQEDALRAFIRSQGIGCNGIKLVFNGTQCHGTHVRRRAVPEDCLKQLDKGILDVFYY